VAVVRYYHLSQRGQQSYRLWLPLILQAFHAGIPYAKPPVGERRFRRPEPLEEPYANGVLDATRRAEVCAQPGMVKSEWLTSLLGGYRGSEDCLTLNVYVPNVDRETGPLLPVMVWVHGGGFAVGEANDHMYGPR
jgi:para-nitrobenzyl esterase